MPAHRDTDPGTPLWGTPGKEAGYGGPVPGDNCQGQGGREILQPAGKNLDQLARDSEERFGIRGNRFDGRLQLETEQAEAFIPRLPGEVGAAVASVDLHKPALDDAFLKLTGRAISDEGASTGDFMRTVMRRRMH